MENIPPEGCPLLLANPHRARRPGRVMYLTVEEVEHRGLATLPVRVRAQQDSAGKLATWLTAHPPSGRCTTDLARALHAYG